MKLTKTIWTKLFAIGLGATMALGVGLTASRGFNEVRAASPVTVDGTSFTTTDENQSATIGGVTIGGFLKQYQTTKLWLTSGKGYIYNSTDLGSISKLTLTYNSGGSASAIQRFNFGASAMTSYMSSGGTTRSTSTGGTSYDETGGVGKGFFNISVSSKNLQLANLVIEYSGGVATYDVSFDSNGGTPTPTSMAVAQNETFTFPSPGSKSGYIFDGWSSDGGTTKFAAGSTSPAVTGAITYTAYWSALPELQSIAITGSLSKTTYFTTDSWSPAGLTVTGTYSSGPTQDLTDQVSWSYDPATPSSVSTTSVTITASYGGKTSPQVTRSVGVSVAPFYSATLVYPGGTTVSNTEATKDLSSSLSLTGTPFSAVATKNGPSNNIGLNTDGTTRLYGNKTDGNGNLLTVSLTSTDYKIVSLAITFGASTNSATVLIEADSSQLYSDVAPAVDTIQSYSLLGATLSSADSFTIKNTHKTSGSIGQVWIKSIEILYATPAQEAALFADDVVNGEGLNAQDKCEVVYDSLMTKYNALSEGAKAIFDSSSDTLFVNARARMAYLTSWVAAQGSGSGNSLILESSPSRSALIVTLIVGIIGLSTVAGFYFLKKKKETF